MKIAPNQEKHLLSYRQLLVVLLSLLCLTGLTVTVSNIDLGALNIYLSLFIATSKAAVVGLFFMHLKDESFFIKSTFLSTLAILSIFIGLMLVDVIFR